MSVDIERWEYSWDDSDGQCATFKMHDEGSWVKYDQVLPLIQELEELRARKSEIEERERKRTITIRRT